MSKPYKIFGCKMIIDLDRVIMVLADDAKRAPPYSITIYLDGCPVAGTITLNQYDHLVLVHRDLERALTGSVGGLPEEASATLAREASTASSGGG